MKNDDAAYTSGTETCFLFFLKKKKKMENNIDDYFNLVFYRTSMQKIRKSTEN